LMLFLEPVLHCIPNNKFPVLTTRCPEGREQGQAYSFFSSLAMLAYYAMLIDLSVFSTHISAFVLVCGRVLSELMQFLFALLFFTLAFAAAVSCLEQENVDFSGLPMSFLQLLKISMGMFRGSHWDKLHDEPWLLLVIFAYVLVSIICLLNVLVAQLICSYHTTYLDMLGYARLSRGRVVVNTMQSVTNKRWTAFFESLKLDERVEFGEGDIGLPGGMQVLEPANANITTVDMITRFGGSTSPSAPWPEDATMKEDDELARFERMEKLLEKVMDRVTTKGAAKGGTGSVNESSNMDSNNESGSGASQGEE